MGMIFCKCGCNKTLEEFDSRKRKRKYIHGHNKSFLNKSHSTKSRLQISNKHSNKHLSKEHKLNISNSLKGINTWARGQISPNKGVIASKETRLKMSIRRIGKYRGNKSHSWKGGITELNHLIRTNVKYSEWRLMIFGRDNYTCQQCNTRGIWLEAHHIKRFSDIIKDNNIKTLDEALICIELWDLNNGITLCKECHKKIKK